VLLDKLVLLKVQCNDIVVTGHTHKNTSILLGTQKKPMVQKKLAWLVHVVLCLVIHLLDQSHSHEALYLQPCT
jgi:hypothetical protein